MNKTCYFTLLALALGSSLSFAQLSPRESDIMYRKEVVRAIDLREPQNRSLFSKNREITAFLIKAVNDGKLKPYSNDSLTNLITIEEFTKRMTIPGTEVIADDAIVDDSGEMVESAPGPDLYFAKDLYQMELKEDIYFTKGKSQLDYNIKALTIFVPGDHPANIRGIQTVVAYLKKALMPFHLITKTMHNIKILPMHLN